MQVGMNSNIHHQAKVLHVQTEDSGYEHGHIITHIFLAGSIVASQKLDYSSDCNETTIQELIKKQHHEMITALKTGQFDKKILLKRAKPQSTIPLARKSKSVPLSNHKSNQSPKVSASTVTTEAVKTATHPNTETQLNPHLKAQGIWALPEFHRRASLASSEQVSKPLDHKKTEDNDPS